VKEQNLLKCENLSLPECDTVTGYLVLTFEGSYNEELYALCSSPDIIHVIKSRREMGRICSTYGAEERCVQGFSGETSGKETTWKTQTKVGG
jgi:hypothetical protein